MSSLALRLGLLALGARTALADCVSYGMDFQNGGSYFQNSLSYDNFTFVSEFEGCANDVAYNVLIDPNGDQTICSNTNLTPDDADQLSTCPIMKSQLFSGPWSIVIMSNNGQEDPSVAYERDFELSVGPQSTSTYTPTVSVTVTSTPIINVTQTTTDTISTTLPPNTVTSPLTTVKPTVTVTPATTTSTSVKALLTLKLTAYTLQVVPATKTKTASCIKPTRQARHDPTATVKITVGPGATITPGAKMFRREVLEAQKARWLQERRDRLDARAPDPQPLVVTDTSTSDWITSTSTVTAAATTATVISTAFTTTTITPAPITVLAGTTTAAIVTITAPTPTKVVTKYTIAASITTKTIGYTYTITSTTTPAAVSTACKKVGGTLF